MLLPFIARGRQICCNGKKFSSDKERARCDLVGARRLDVTRLLALVTQTVGAGFLWAFAAQVTNLATVVAFLALCAIARHVTETAA